MNYTPDLTCSLGMSPENNLHICGCHVGHNITIQHSKVESDIRDSSRPLRHYCQEHHTNMDGGGLLRVGRRQASH